MMSEQNSQQSAVKIAIVTGGSRGIGRNTVVNLARRGVRSILTYHSHRAEADAVVAAIRDAGAQAVAVQLDTGDVSAFDTFEQSVQSALKSLGATHFDYLVNNAGNNHHNMAFEKTTEEELDSLYDVHFTLRRSLQRCVFPEPEASPPIKDGGRIVNVSTGRTRIISHGGAAYGSMKGAIEVLTKYMAKELGPRRIAVNVVAPGAVATDFSGGVVRDNPEVNKHIAEMTALGRVGIPEDIGPMIASLLSEDNRWVNAQRIEVSGGMAI
jgi:NAD(P)-dependent dehydrogenase (short-subunit alcohol dehydrogenase family)